MLSTRLPDVHLERAPLVLALCQFRFNDVEGLVNRDSVHSLREWLRPEYSDLSQQSVPHGVQIQFSPGKDPVAAAAEELDSFTLRNPHHSWHLRLTSGVATVFATSYTTRDDFMGRVSALRSGLRDVLGVPAITRLGIRYVNRVTDEAVLERLGAYVQAELLGAAHAPIAAEASLVQSLNDIFFEHDTTAVRMRVGLVPPGVQPDPAVQPVDAPSWICDVDTFDSMFRTLDEAVDQRAAALAEDAYQLFRWAVTDRFLDHFRGDS